MELHPFDQLALTNGASLIFTPCPGTKDTSVSDAIQTLKDAGADAVITLLSNTELEALSVDSLRSESSTHGLIWFQLPIRDDSEPDTSFEEHWKVSKPAILNLIKQDKTIAIHCRGGSGRTGLMAAILLLEAGYQWDYVKKQIQTLRPAALTLSEHLNYLNKRYSI